MSNHKLLKIPMYLRSGTTVLQHSGVSVNSMVNSNTYSGIVLEVSELVLHALSLKWVFGDMGQYYF